MTSSEAETFLLETHDGVPVVVHHWKPEAQVRGVVNLVHGLGDHARRYAHVAAALNGIGLEVYAPDLRGHGETVDLEGELGLYAEERGWARVLDDLHRLTVRARREHPDVPAFIFGHSIGSFQAQQYLFTFPSDVDGAVLSGIQLPGNPLFEFGPLLANLERLRIGPRGRSPLLTRLTTGEYNRKFSPSRTPHDWLSRDTEQVDIYDADPKCGFDAPVQTLRDIGAGVRLIQQVERLRAIPSSLPIYIFAGSEDPQGGRAGVKKLAELYAEAGLTNVETRVYEGARHETLHEINRDEVIADLVDWFDREVRRVDDR